MCYPYPGDKERHGHEHFMPEHGCSGNRYVYHNQYGRCIHAEGEHHADGPVKAGALVGSASPETWEGVDGSF